MPGTGTAGRSGNRGGLGRSRPGGGGARRPAGPRPPAPGGAHRPRRTLAGLALAWLLAEDRVRTIVLGPGRPEHLAPVREALAHPLNQAELAAIEEAVA